MSEEMTYYMGNCRCTLHCPERPDGVVGRLRTDGEVDFVLLNSLIDFGEREVARIARGRKCGDARLQISCRSLPDVHHLISKGFTLAGRFSQLYLEPADFFPMGSQHKITSAKDVAPGDWVKMFNDAFSDHWNFYPMTKERCITELNKPEAFNAVEASMKGFVSYKPKNTRVGTVGTLGVVREHRGQGIGRALLNYAITRLIASGFRLIEIDVNDSNDAAMALYLDTGFAKKSWSAIMEKSVAV